MKKISLYAVAVLMLLTSNALYATEHFIAPNIKVSIEFEPSQEQVISNPLFWSVSIECELSSEAQSIPIRALAVKKSTSVNGYLLEEGNSLYTTLMINKKLLIKAEGSAKISLTNHAKQSVKAICNV